MVNTTLGRLPSCSVLLLCTEYAMGRSTVSSDIIRILMIYKIYFSEMNDSKCLHVLTQSGRCYVPIDDPPEVVIRKITEVMFKTFVSIQHG